MVEKRERKRRESGKMSYRVDVGGTLRCNGESERERERKERCTERKSETGIAREQPRTRATYDSTLVDCARRGAERFDKTQFSLRERRFHSLINISVRIGRFIIRFVFMAAWKTNSY